jgi:hypothetical protein
MRFETLQALSKADAAERNSRQDAKAPRDQDLLIRDFRNLLGALAPLRERRRRLCVSP